MPNKNYHSKNKHPKRVFHASFGYIQLDNRFIPGYPIEIFRFPEIHSDRNPFHASKNFPLPAFHEGRQSVFINPQASTNQKCLQGKMHQRLTIQGHLAQHTSQCRLFGFHLSPPVSTGDQDLPEKINVYPAMPFDPICYF